nr:hypothetical protein [uncultured Rhodopila sp.]
MLTISRSLLLSAALLSASLTGAMAQGTNPAGNYGSNRSMTAAPGTADSTTKSGMNTGDVHSRGSMESYSGARSDPRTPGGTGRTVVPGSSSSQASAATGTANARTDGTTGGSK